MDLEQLWCSCTAMAIPLAAKPTWGCSRSQVTSPWDWVFNIKSQLKQVLVNLLVSFIRQCCKPWERQVVASVSGQKGHGRKVSFSSVAVSHSFWLLLPSHFGHGLHPHSSFHPTGDLYACWSLFPFACLRGPIQFQDFYPGGRQLLSRQLSLPSIFLVWTMNL